jgi:hypothetical protein
MVASFTGNLLDARYINCEMGTLTKLSELAIGDNKRAQVSQPFQSFIAVLLSSLLINGNIRKSGVSAINLL